MRVDAGTDPREVKRDRQTASIKKKAADLAHAVTVGEAWTPYMAARQPRWGAPLPRP